MVISKHARIWELSIKNVRVAFGDERTNGQYETNIHPSSEKGRHNNS
jgi:hypothetical protein